MHSESVAPRYNGILWQAVGLLAGGALAFAGSFLPLATITTPPTPQYSEPGSAFTYIPAQSAARIFLAPDTCLISFAIWGAPLVLAALGVWMLLARRVTLRTGTLIAGLLLILLGVMYVLLFSALYLYPRGGVIPSHATLGPGPFVMLAGYLITLFALIELFAHRRSMSQP